MEQHEIAEKKIDGGNVAKSKDKTHDVFVQKRTRGRKRALLLRRNKRSERGKSRLDEHSYRFTFESVLVAPTLLSRLTYGHLASTHILLYGREDEVAKCNSHLI